MSAAQIQGKSPRYFSFGGFFIGGLVIWAITMRMANDCDNGYRTAVKDAKEIPCSIYTSAKVHVSHSTMPPEILGHEQVVA